MKFNQFFIDRGACVISKKPCLAKVREMFSNLFFYKFYRFEFTFRSVIHFGLIFIYVAKCCSRVNWFEYRFPVIPAPFVIKDHPSSIELSLPRCQKSIDDIFIGLFLDCLFYFILFSIVKTFNRSLNFHTSFLW